jgi:FADH2 O2-dependent halogenase
MFSSERVNADFDIAVVGSGFGGSLLAMIARRLGRSVVLVERGTHPRFVIGESSTPLANLLLEELTRRYFLPRLTPLAKWGSWQKAYPDISCGLKRGFSFYHHTAGKAWRADPQRQNELLVAASPHDGIADTHWYRPDFDHFLVREAQALGVEYLDQVKLEAAELSPDSITLSGRRKETNLSLRVRFVVDASGPRGFLHRALALPEKFFPDLPPTQALYAHFSGVGRWDRLERSSETDPSPYPVDDAAMHHIFDGGWIWVLRFNNGLTSAGVAATDEVARKFKFADGASAWSRLLQMWPSVHEQFVLAQPTFPFVHSPRLSFRSGVAVGANWALLPSAAGFVDPLLSTGFPLALQGIRRLAEIFERDWKSERLDSGLNRYGRQTFEELDIAGQLVAALYSSMNNPRLFTAVSLLYFAAASFTETAKRLGRHDLAGEAFLLCEDPKFGPSFRHCLERVLSNRKTPDDEEVIDQIYSVIEPVDIAGLADRVRRNWYDVRADDLLNASHKLGVSKTDIEAMLTHCGFFEASAPESKL